MLDGITSRHSRALYRSNNRMDIVLVGSDSLATVRVTHAN